MNPRTNAPAAIAALLLALSCAAGARAQQGHSIRGKVRDASGSNVPRATITLERNGAMIEQTVTNNEGDFSFQSLEDTSYTVVASAVDYNPGSETVEFVRAVKGDEPGELRTIEITLTPRGGVRPPRAGLNFAQNVPREAREAFESGLRLAADPKRAPEAAAAYERAVQLFPDYFDARLVLAASLVGRGQLDDAIKHLDVARRVNERDDRVWDLFARVLLRQGKYAVAARVFAQAASLNPNEPQYPLAQGAALIEQGAAIDPARSKSAADERAYAFTEAEKALLRANQLSLRKLADVHLQLARLHEKRGEPARAADELEQYLRKAPNAKNAEAIRQGVKKLRAQAAAGKKP
jgi:hypothetical protein